VYPPRPVPPDYRAFDSVYRTSEPKARIVDLVISTIAKSGYSQQKNTRGLTNLNRKQEVAAIKGLNESILERRTTTRSEVFEKRR
jgi:hypothetical protein